MVDGRGCWLRPPPPPFPPHTLSLGQKPGHHPVPHQRRRSRATVAIGEIWEGGTLPGGSDRKGRGCRDWARGGQLDITAV